MIEKKTIPEADMALIRTMDEKLEALVKMHHKVRKDFIRTEALLIKEHMVCESELRTFIVGIAKSLDISEDEMIKSWRLDLATGTFTKESADPEPEPELILEPEVVAEPKLSKEQQALEDIRKKYQR